MAAIKRPNLDLKMGYSGGVNLPLEEQAGYQAVADVEGKNLRYVRASGTTGQRPDPPVKGLTYYDETLGELIFHNGSAWEPVLQDISEMANNKVLTLADLPEPDEDGIITLPTNGGLWDFCGDFVDGEAEVTLVAEVGNVLKSRPDNGFRSAHPTLPAVTVKNHINPFLFQAYSDYVGGIGLCLNAPGSLRQTLTNWIALTPVQILSSNAVIWDGGFCGACTLPAVGGNYEFHRMAVASAAVVGTGPVGKLIFKDILGTGGAAPLLTIPDTVHVTKGVTFRDCEIDPNKKLLVAGTGVNNSGAAFPHLDVQGCYCGSTVGDVTLGAVWAGGMLLSGNSRLAATADSGFVGFAHNSTRTTLLNNTGVFGAAYTNTSL